MWGTAVKYIALCAAEVAVKKGTFDSVLSLKCFTSIYQPTNAHIISHKTLLKH